MKKRSIRCIISIAIVMLLSVFVLSGCTKKKQEDQKDTDVKENLQADESVDEEEGPSVNFEDIFSNENEEDAVEEDNKQENNKQENNKQENNKQESNKQESNKQESNKQENKQEVNKQENNKQEDKEDLEGVGGNTEQGWSPFY